MRKKKTSKLGDIESIEIDSEAIQSIQSEWQRENPSKRMVKIGLTGKMTFKQKFEEGHCMNIYRKTTQGLLEIMGLESDCKIVNTVFSIQ